MSSNAYPPLFQGNLLTTTNVRLTRFILTLDLGVYTDETRGCETIKIGQLNAYQTNISDTGNLTFEAVVRNL